MKRTIQWSVLFLCVASVFGCSAFKGSLLSPQLSSNEDKIAEELERKYLSYENGTEISRYEKDLAEGKMKDDEVKKQRRNQILSNLILLMNIRYAQYERCFYRVSAGISTIFDTTVLGLTAAGTVAGGNTTKSILSAIAAGIAGTKLSMEKNYLFEKTSPVLMAKMRSLREEKLRIIDERMNKSIQEYPLERGLIDVQDFFYCGTISGALQSISADIGKQPTYNEIIKSFKDMRAKVNNVFEDSANADTNGSATTAVR